jgi:hypothetical protein
MKQRYLSPPHSQPQIQLGHIPKGYLGTTKTIQQMQVLIRAGVKDFYVRQKAIDILFERRVKPKDYVGEIKALFEWVQHNIRYTKDPFRLEVLRSPRRMLELRAGDCDDMSILLGAMLEAIGHPVRLVLAGPDPLRPRLFTHVYLEVYYKGRWIPLDPTMPYPMGWAPRTLVKKTVSIERRVTMASQDIELQGLEATMAVPDWLRGLIRAVRREGLRPRDERVRMLWNLLRQRRLLGRSRWLQDILRYAWNRGLVARPRPRLARRLVGRLRRWGILPPPMQQMSVRHPVTNYPLAPGRRPPARFMPLRSVRPVMVRPVTRATASR